jgi:hypothetical protein
MTERYWKRCLRCHEGFLGTPKQKYCYVTNCLPPTVGPLDLRIEGGVYFVLFQGFVKIGIPTDIKNRLKSVHSSHPLPLTLLGVIPLPPKMHRAKERSIHDQFAHLRQQGEWFRAEPELLQYIKENARDVHPFLTEELERLAPPRPRDCPSYRRVLEPFRVRAQVA